ncbi:MAG: DUF4760 domain-containing protein [Terriglobia bacterium]
MREHPDHHDAELLLRLYDLRREEKLRQARQWFLTEFEAAPAEELVKKYPPTSKENTYYRMVVSYWDMAASIVNNGLIKEDLFFENTAELLAVWLRGKPVITEMRRLFKNPNYSKNLETLANKYEKWMQERAPGALEAMMQRIQTIKKTA